MTWQQLEFDAALATLKKYRPSSTAVSRNIISYTTLRSNGGVSKGATQPMLKPAYAVSASVLSVGAITQATGQAVLASGSASSTTMLSTGALTQDVPSGGVWTQIPNFKVSFGKPSEIDLNPYLTGNPALTIALTSSVLPPWLKLDSAGQKLIYDGKGVSGDVALALIIAAAT